MLTPLYFRLDITGRQYAPPTSYPQFFYGFLAVAIAWQIAFLVIGSNPARFRLLMIPSIVEKFGYVATVVVLYSQARISATDATAAVPDLLLGCLFTAAFAKTRASDQRGALARGTPMLELRPTCEHCNKPLPPDALDARMCSYECTFCVACAEGILGNVCPNCGGGFVPRPIRPAKNWRGDNFLGKNPAGTRIRHRPVDAAAHARFSAPIRGIPPEKR